MLTCKPWVHVKLIYSIYFLNRVRTTASEPVGRTKRDRNAGGLAQTVNSLVLKRYTDLFNRKHQRNKVIRVCRLALSRTNLRAKHTLWHIFLPTYLKVNQSHMPLKGRRTRSVYLLPPPSPPPPPPILFFALLLEVETLSEAHSWNGNTFMSSLGY